MNKLAKQFKRQAEQFPLRLKQLRLAKGFTQDELAERCNIKREIIGKAEVGHNVANKDNPDEKTRKYNVPKQDNLVKIAAILGTTPAQLVYGAIELPALNKDVQLLAKRIQKIPASKRDKAIADINALIDCIV